MYHTYKSLPELSQYHDDQKKIIFSRVCLRGRSLYISWLFLFVALSVLNSIDIFKVSNSPFWLKLVIKSLFGGSAFYLYFVLKLNSIDRFLLNDFNKAAQQGDAPARFAPGDR